MSNQLWPGTYFQIKSKHFSRNVFLKLKECSVCRVSGVCQDIINQKYATNSCYRFSPQIDKLIADT